jgi:hypothetical protein
LLVDDRVVATWKRRLTSKTAICSATLLAPLTATRLAALRRALDRYATFLQRDAVLKVG